MTESVLQEAERLINGDRAKDYGDVTVNFKRIAGMWGAYKGAEFTPHDVAQMMILVKVARQATGYHRDSNVDIAGYAGLDEQVYDKLEVIPDGPVFMGGVDFVIGERFPDDPFDWDITIGQTPRVWLSLYEVNHDLKVTDVDSWVTGRVWSYDNAARSWGYVTREGERVNIGGYLRSRLYDYLGPFTEILEGTE